MRDGYKHLYLYNLDGTLVKQVTKGEYEVEGFIKFDKKGENIFIYANKDNLAGRDAYRVNLKKGTMECLTMQENGLHGTHSSSLTTRHHVGGCMEQCGYADACRPARPQA